MEGRLVRCGTCGGVYYETTDTYDPDKPLTGDMLRLCKPFSSYQWPTYDGSLAVASTSRFLMFCCSCAGMISSTGKLCFVDEELGSEPVEDVVVEKIPEFVERESLVLLPEDVFEKIEKKPANEPAKKKKKKKKGKG